MKLRITILFLIMLSLVSHNVTPAPKVVPLSKPNVQKKERNFVKNHSDFEFHTRVHIMNTAILGMSLYHKYKNEYFFDVPEALLQEKLNLHDQEKLAPLSELMQMGYIGEKNLSEQLYAFYGYNKDDLNDVEKLQFLEIIGDLYRFWRIYEMAFHIKYNLLNPDRSLNAIAVKIATIEKLADIVERGESLVSPEEFGKTEMIRGSHFLKDLTPAETEMIIYLEKEYFNITVPHPLYEAHNNRLGKMCSPLFKN